MFQKEKLFPTLLACTTLVTPKFGLQILILIPGCRKEGQEVMIPDMHVLPYAPRNDLVINVPEMRMYYYDKHASSGVRSFPISVGRQEWTTPHGAMLVTGKLEAPSWYPPASILKEHEEMGEPLPRVVPAGPDNPLGRYALLLSKKGYLIHGTNKPYGIGMRVTHGCIRMYPKHIEWLFTKISVWRNGNSCQSACESGALQ